MINFPIYFSNLNEETQRRLLEAIGAKDPSEMNWDMDILPIAELEFENEADELRES